MSKSMRRKMAGVLSTAMIVGSLPLAANVIENNSSDNNEVVAVKEATTVATSPSELVVHQANENKIVENVRVLDFNKVAAMKYNADFTIGDFTVKVGEGKTIEVSSNSQMGEYYHSFTQQLKFGGKGAKDNRSIHFETTGPVTVQVYAISTKDGAGRDLTIYNEKDVSVGAATVYGQGDVKDGDKKLPMYTIELDRAGKYYLMPEANISLYYMSVTEGTVKVDDFTEGSVPEVESVKQNEEDGNIVNVVVKGTTPNTQTDKLWVKMYDEFNKLIQSKIVNELTNGQAKVAFNPTKNGTYYFACEAIREGANKGYSSKKVDSNIVLPLGKMEFENVKTGDNNTLNVDWNDVRNAVSYTITLVGEDGKEETVTDLKESKYTFENLTPGEKYTITVVATDGGTTKEITTHKVLAHAEERFMAALVGSGASGEVIENADGSVTIAAVEVGTGSGGKLADSEDGFVYYYTEIDPSKENFTLTATFHIDDAAKKDNQSGFGVMAIDTFEAGSSSARYFNSAGSMVRKYSRTIDGNISSVTGIPGGFFVTGYTGVPILAPEGARKNIDTAPFDWNFKADTMPSGPRFETGEEYTLTLRKSNTGFHASMINNATGEKTEEVICYEPELLLQQDKDKYYVGVCASRKITVTAKDMKFTTIDPQKDDPKQERPMSFIEPTFNFNSTTTTGSVDYEAAFRANYAGTIDILDSKGNKVAENIKITPVRADKAARVVADLKLNKGANTYTAIYTPLPKEEQGNLLSEYEELRSYEPIKINFTVDYKTYGTEANAIYVSPTATAAGEGTKVSPLNLYTAIDYAQPGQEIVLLGGTYKLDKGITVNRGHNGTADKPIVLMSDPNQKAILDFTGSKGIGVTLGGDYWHVYNMEVKNAGAQGVQITGNHNTVEKLAVYGSGNTGIQISGSGTEENIMWPSYNLVQSCESYNNCDALANDADGFAAKLTVGPENIFRYCISHHNIDDGWDLYAKSTTGNIAEVLVEKSVTYANGKLETGDLTGEGNGFKLGGESRPVAHILRDSISFDNIKNGVFSNSNPSCKVSNVISFNNLTNLSFNKTNHEKSEWALDNFISYNGKTPDEIALKEQDSLTSATNYLDGVNIKGDTVKDNWFTSLESVVPTIAEDGSIDMGDFLRLTSNAPAGIGTIFTANPNPTVITIGTEIGTNNPGGSTGGSNSSSGGSSSKKTTTETVVDANKQSIEAAIKENKVPTFAVNANHKVDLSKDAVNSLLSNKLDVTFTAGSTSLRMNNILLNSMLNKEAAMNVQMTKASEENYKKLQGKMPNGLKLVGDQSTTMEIAVNTDKAVNTFEEPATVSFDLAKVAECNPAKLTLIRYEIQKDDTVSIVKLGGHYNKKTKAFTAKIDKRGSYAVVEADELLKINMTIGDKTSTVDDKNISNDIAPQIINGSTMVPVRFIAENLGAEVKWDGKKKQVNINLNGEIVTVNSKDGMMIKDSRTLVPIRYVSEKLGANVLWVGSTKEIEIVK